MNMCFKCSNLYLYSISPFFFRPDELLPAIKTSLKQVKAMIIFCLKILGSSMFNCNFFPCTEMTVRKMNYDHLIA